jgi:hypothetical protein
MDEETPLRFTVEQRHALRQRAVSLLTDTSWKVGAMNQQDLEKLVHWNERADLTFWRRVYGDLPGFTPRRELAEVGARMLYAATATLRPIEKIAWYVDPTEASQKANLGQRGTGSVNAIQGALVTHSRPSQAVPLSTALMTLFDQMERQFMGPPLRIEDTAMLTREERERAREAARDRNDRSLSNAPHVSTALFALNEEPSSETRAAVIAMLLVMENSFGMWPRMRAALLCEMPTCHFDMEGRLHSELGPAIVFGARSNGWPVRAVYMHHGVPVPRKVIMSPKELTVEEILAAENAEVRRVMVEKYDPVRFLKDAGFRELQSDECGTLYMRSQDSDDVSRVWDRANLIVRPMKYVMVHCPTGRDYALRVPPETVTARQGVAWTFNQEAWQYDPRQQQ